MTVRFRNVEVDPDTPVQELPAEAIETVIDRGSLSDWRILGQAIRADPWGRVARIAEQIASSDEHYGIDALITEMVRRAREEVESAGRRHYADQIRSWRTEAGMSLRELARAAGTSAPRLSAYENAKVAPTTDVLGRLHHAAHRRRD